MRGKYSESQRIATEKYMQDKHVIRVTVTKTKAAEYKELAAAAGKSLNQYIIDILEAHIAADRAN